ncbi:MAG TPA: efflux RND transporter periplasmic adaptor subunit [Ignavibacteria bacterium]|nr:efflux RND transporter periplasmic adaptor subunit [Ignavibacteria bacterium]HMR40518.1 efflux RND transporter periplasmic adaptor subunit [Ignavibacteria bacterium]
MTRKMRREMGREMIKNINRIIVLTIINIAFSFAIIGCNSKEDITKEAGHDDHDEHKGEINGEVALTQEQINLMGIEFSGIEARNINGYIAVNGELMMNQDNESKVGSIIPGRVKRIYVKEGSFVRAGQTLAVIENPDLINVQVDYINAKNKFDFAKQEYDRHQKLSSDNIGSKKNLAEIESNYKSAMANYKTLEEKLKGYKISKNRLENIYTDSVADLQKSYSISAPISGNVVSRMITIGQYVEPSMDMFHIVNTNSLFADLSIYEKDLKFVRTGQKVFIKSGSNPGRSYEGKVSFVNKVFDDVNRSVKVRVTVNNSTQELYPFMFVTAKIYVTDESVRSVPVSAIETEGENKYVFVKTDEKKMIENHSEHGEEDGHSDEEHKEEMGIVFKKVIVKTGISDDQFTEIYPVTEIKAGEEVVSKGTFYLKSELKKEELGGHEH